MSSLYFSCCWWQPISPYSHAFQISSTSSIEVSHTFHLQCSISLEHIPVLYPCHPSVGCLPCTAQIRILSHLFAFRTVISSRHISITFATHNRLSITPLQTIEWQSYSSTGFLHQTPLSQISFVPLSRYNFLLLFNSPPHCSPLMSFEVIQIQSLNSQS